MLLSLQIENYALIRSLNIRFDKGFTVITGETGAGKSILMGALSLILGNRADSSILHDTSKKCFVEVEFDIDNLVLESFFEENDLDYQRISIIRREITPTGKSRAFINDSPVNLNVLKSLAENLVDIHSQHHHLLIRHAAFRLQVIDEYAQTQQELSAYKNVYSNYRIIENKCGKLRDKIAQGNKENDYLEFVGKELLESQLIPGEQEELEAKISYLSHAEQIKNHLFASSQILSEQEGNIIEQLRSLEQQVKPIVSYNDRFQEMAERLEKVILEVKDISFDISKMEDAVEVNPQAIESYRERLDLLFSLQQKHHVSSVEELIKVADDIQNKLKGHSAYVNQLEEMEIQRKQLYEDLIKLAKQLSEKRKRAIPVLEKDILSKFNLLGMENATFVVEHTLMDVPGEYGIDEVIFQFSANKGSKAIEIEKVASGGEMSRVMLAIKSVITENALLPTVIFDEIDTGISGEIAGKVAALMSEIARQRQLLVITHLPQIAAKGELHYYVYKNVENDDTYTSIKQIEQDERVYEIAKMISGENVTETSLKAAMELIYRKNNR